MNQMQVLLLKTAVEVLVKFCSPEILKTAADAILDIVEDSVAQSENKIDDAIILPLCQQIRTAFDLADND